MIVGPRCGILHPVASYWPCVTELSMGYIVVIHLLDLVKSGVRSKLLMSAVTLSTACLFVVESSPVLKLLLILALLASSEVMILQWGDYWIEAVVARLKMAGRVVSWDEIPEFTAYRELARQMGVKLNRKRPFGVQEGLKNAYADPLTGQVVIGDQLLRGLAPEQMLAVIAHELTHLKKNHASKMLLTGLLLACLVFAALSHAGAPRPVAFLATFAAYMIAFVCVNQENEYSADSGAARQVGGESLIAALQEIVPRERWSIESETHPSVQDRVSRLRRKGPE